MAGKISMGARREVLAAVAKGELSSKITVEFAECIGVCEGAPAVLLERLPVSPAAPTPWLDFDAALAYLGFSRDRLYKLTAARAIPFRKKRDGQGLLFHRGELDRWLEQEYPATGCAG